MASAKKSSLEMNGATVGGPRSAVDHEVLIEPRRIPGDPKIGDTVILALFEPYVEILRRELKIKKKDLGRMRFPSMNFASIRMGEKNISLVGAPLGAPAAVILLERLIAMGAKNFVALGCCGSLQVGLKVGDCVIPTAAVAEEGTSAHYPLPEGVKGRGDESMNRLMMEIGMKRKIPLAAGPVWTTDALFRETRGKVKRFSDHGLLAVEMEISALLTVAAYRQKRLGALLVVSDELALLKWKTGFLNPFFWLASKKAARLAIEIAQNL